MDPAARPLFRQALGARLKMQHHQGIFSLLSRSANGSG